MIDRFTACATLRCTVIFCLLCRILSAQSYPPVTLIVKDNEVSIENGFVRMVLSPSDHSIQSLDADFYGNGGFGNAENINVLSKPVLLELKSSRCELKIIDTLFEVIIESDDQVLVQLSSTFGCNNVQQVQESWKLSLSRGYRTLVLNIKGEAIRNIRDVAYFGHGIYTQSASLYGLFDRGVVQMMSYEDHCLTAVDTMPRSYFIGNGTALDVVFSSETSVNSDVILMTQHRNSAAGLLNIVVGNISPNGTSLNYDLAWKSCVKTFESLDDVEVDVPSGTKWAVDVELSPNNFNFPVYSMADVSSQPALFSMDDLATYMTGVYASPAGCLKSYYQDWQGTIAPTIAHPDTGYSPDTNFFDPDNYISLSALLCKFQLLTNLLSCLYDAFWHLLVLLRINQ